MPGSKYLTIVNSLGLFISERADYMSLLMWVDVRGVGVRGGIDYDSSVAYTQTYAHTYTHAHAHTRTHTHTHTHTHRVNSLLSRPHCQYNRVKPWTHTEGC